MAFCVQNPGVKIRHGLILKGIPGDGKTVVAGAMRGMMGRANTRQVSAKVLGTDFNGWAIGCCIAFLEELKLHGHNKYDIVNALKEHVTNDVIEAHTKGKDSYDAINTVNFMAFTNFADAVPLDDTDRRWMVVFSAFANMMELAVAIRTETGATGTDEEVTAAYFVELFWAVDTQPAELRRAFLDRDLAGFNPNMRAPMTPEKLVMIGMNKNDEEGAVADAIEQGALGVSKDVFSSAALVNLVQAGDSEFSLNTSQVPALLRKMGYVKFDKRVFWNGAPHRVWLRSLGTHTADSIKAALDKTIGNVTVEGDCSDLFA